jgi:hypothetical protein
MFVPIYEFAQSGTAALTTATFSSVNVRERRDLQRLLRENVEVIAPDARIILSSAEFSKEVTSSV